MSEEMKDMQTPDAGAQDGGNVANGGQDTAGQDAPKSDVKTITQEELDRIIQQRLQRERKKWEQQIEEERRKAAMTEAERLKAEKEEAERKAQEAQAAAHRRIIQAEAKAQALALGVRPERLEYALRLADLSEVEVGDDGEPDAAAIKAALEKVLNDLPELRGATAPAKSGSEFQGGNTADRNPWSKEHFNLTEQGRISRENPQLAARLMKEAKAKRSG